MSSSIRERVYLMAQSKASERINVIVTFIVGSLQEWRQMMTRAETMRILPEEADRAMGQVQIRGLHQDDKAGHAYGAGGHIGRVIVQHLVQMRNATRWESAISPSITAKEHSSLAHSAVRVVGSGILDSIVEAWCSHIGGLMDDAEARRQPAYETVGMRTQWI
ncbi:unnamed protein product [Zymoseptoria tritici ST99CH_3D1]|nr:unnamed protein product [Zymoseptoria tritici ST99CH_3D1]